MILLKNDEIDLEKWNLFLNENKFASPFQSYAFYSFINSVSGQTASVFAIEKNNELQALCVVTFQKEKGIKGYFSRRAIIYGGPVIKEDVQSLAALNLLLSTISRHLKPRIIYGEIRNSADYGFYKSCFTSLGWEYLPHLNVQISLQNRTIEDILGEMKYNRRREIKLSLKEGAIIKEASNIEEIHALYSILKGLYIARVKSPLPTFEFFEKLYLSPAGKIFLVVHKNQVIGGSFCIFHSGLSVNTLYYCGLRDYDSKIFPTDLAILAAIEFGIKNNLLFVDLMGAGKPDEEYGVRNYKVAFGGNLIEYGRFKKIYSPLLYRIGTLGLELLNKIK